MCILFFRKRAGYICGADYGRRDQTTCSCQRPVSQIENLYCCDPTRKVGDRYNCWIHYKQEIMTSRDYLH